MKLGATAHTDTFTRDALPPLEQWPDFLLDGFDYPDHLDIYPLRKVDKNLNQYYLYKILLDMLYTDLHQDLNNPHHIHNHRHYHSQWDLSYYRDTVGIFPSLYLH